MSKNRSKNGEGKRIRTPENRVLYWGLRGIAELDTAYKEPVSYLIGTDKGIDTPLSVLAVSSTGERWRSTIDERRSALSWKLEAYAGTDEKLIAAVSSLVHISGYKTPESISSDSEIRPYRDLLFISGEVEVSFVEDPTTSIFIGKLAGLTIVSDNQHHPVWIPRLETIPEQS